MEKHKFNAINLGMALGITWALYLLFIGISAWQFGWGTEAVNMISTWYIGYGPDLYGSILGAIWGFIDGFIGGFIVAWIYNKLQK